MIVVRSNEIESEDIPGVELKTLLPFDVISGGRTRFGMVSIPPKGRIPLKGVAPHDEDEYSILVKGKMITTIGDQEFLLSAGDSTLIPAGEAHAVYNPGEEECLLIWALVKR